MNLDEARQLATLKPPRLWELEDSAAFSEFLKNLDIPIGIYADEYGSHLHIARSFVDFKYFCHETMDYGWKTGRNPSTGMPQDAGFIFGDTDWPGHDEMADHLLSEALRIQVLAPRGSYKTTMLSLHVIWHVGKNPNIRIMYAMDLLRNAKKVVSSMMREMERENYQEVFGKMRPRQGTPGWTIQGVRVVQCERTSKEPTITPGGIDSGITGDHQDRIVLDDLVTEINTRSRERMIKTYDWTKDLEPILDPGAQVFDCGTRWHHADAHGMIQKENKEIQNEDLKWKILILSAEKIDGSPYFKHLDEIKLEAARAKGSYRYSCNYLNRPVSTEDQLFFPEQFKLIHFNNVPKTVHRYLLIDSAATDKKRSSSTVIWCVAIDMIGNIYCLDLQMGRWKPDRVINNFYSMWMRWEPRWATMESNVHGKVYRSYIEAQNRIRQTYLKIREIYGRTERSKHDRIIALQPAFENGSIYFANSIEWDLIHDDGGKAAGRIVDDFTQFPKGMEDDIPDALADVIAFDKDGKVCPSYKRKVGSLGGPQSMQPAISSINGRYPTNAYEIMRAQNPVAAPARGERRYRGRPAGSRFRAKPRR